MLHPPVTRGASVPKHVAYSPLKGAPALPDEGDAELTRAYITARAASSCASEDPYYDAASEAGSFISAASSFERGSPADDAESRDGGGCSPPTRWDGRRFQTEHEARLDAEAAATELAGEKAELQRQVEQLQQEVEQLSSAGGSPHAPAEQPAGGGEGDVAAARLVAGAFARAVAREEASEAWTGEVRLLRQRVERSALMERLAHSQRQSQQAEQGAVTRRAVHVGFAVGCLGLGALAAFLVVRSSRK